MVVMVICIFDDADFPGQSKLTKLHAFTWPKEPLLNTSEDITITLKTITITTISKIDRHDNHHNQIDLSTIVLTGGSKTTSTVTEISNLGNNQVFIFISHDSPWHQHHHTIYHDQHDIDYNHTSWQVFSRDLPSLIIGRRNHACGVYIAASEQVVVGACICVFVCLLCVCMSVSVVFVFACLSLIFGVQQLNRKHVFVCFFAFARACGPLSCFFNRRLSRCCLSLGGRMVSSPILIPQK